MRIVKTFHFRLICISALILLVALFLATTLIFSQYQGSMVAQNRETTLRAFGLAEKKIDRLLSDANKAAVLIKRYKEVDDYLFGSFATQAQRTIAQREMMHALSEALADNHTLNGILFFKDDGTMTGATEPWRFSFEIDTHPFFEKAGLAQLPVETGITWLGGYWLSDFSLQDIPAKNASHIMIVGASRTRYRYSYTPEVRTLTTVFSISESSLQECFDSLNDHSGEVFLLDGRGRQLASSTALALGHIPWFYSDLNQTQKLGSMNLHNAGEKYQLVYYNLGNTDWMLVKKIPFEIYTEQINHLQVVTWMTGILVLLLMSAVYTIWALRFTRPFKDMSSALEQVRKGDLTVQMEHPSGIYEFELMRTEFNSMIQSINTLLEQTKAMEHERIELELRNLQSQLNPHMVFNSITAIRWMAMMSGTSKVSDMLVELAELIRPIFNEWRLVWTLRDEIAYIQHYVKLLRLRYCGMIQVDIRISEEMMDVLLPCFTLQPLLENSSEHGARPSEVICIALEGSFKGDMVQLRITDNGRGMPKEKVALLKERMNALDNRPEGGLEHSGIGLCNIHRRLQMFGGEACGMTLESVEGQGTCITVWLQKQQETPKIAN